MTAVRALTVQDPWISCIVSDAPGAKRVENRGSGTSYRGPLLLHVGKAVNEDAWRDLRVQSLLGSDPSACGQPRGAVVAVADLVDVHPNRNGDRCCQPWGEAMHVGPRSVRWAMHLVLKNVRRLDRPVYCRGALGLWVPSAEVVEQVHAQMDGQAALATTFGAGVR